jgi:hypothetical protein
VIGQPVIDGLRQTEDAEGVGKTPNSELRTRRDVGANPLGRIPNSPKLRFLLIVVIALVRYKVWRNKQKRLNP